jgi:hypothetical protein
MSERQKDKKKPSEKSFLSRWSERKAHAAQGEVLSAKDELLDQGSNQTGDSQIDEEAALSDTELLEKYNLPDPETVEDEGDLDKFMSGNMPERLRQMALRRLWRLNPLFGIVDDMVEYGEDYTDAATVIEGMQTAYTVGKGYLKEILEDEKGPSELVELDDAELVADESKNSVGKDDIYFDDKRDLHTRDENYQVEKVNPSSETSNNSLDKRIRVLDNSTVKNEVPTDLAGIKIRNLAEVETNPNVEPVVLAADDPADIEKKQIKNNDIKNSGKVRPQRMIFQKNKKLS